jgi:hypothetical protein
MSGAIVCLNRLTPKEKASAYRDANLVLDALNEGAPTATAGALRVHLDWEIVRFARAMAALHAEGIQLFNFKVEQVR